MSGESYPPSVLYEHSIYPAGTVVQVDERVLMEMSVPFAGKQAQACQGYYHPADPIDPWKHVPIKWGYRIYLVPERYVSRKQEEASR